MRHPRQACHHHAEGHPAGQAYPWQEKLGNGGECGGGGE